MLKKQKITPYIIVIQGVRCVERVLITSWKGVNKQPSFQHIRVSNTSINSFSTCCQHPWSFLLGFGCYSATKKLTSWLSALYLEPSCLRQKM